MAWGKCASVSTIGLHGRGDLRVDVVQWWQPGATTAAGTTRPRPRPPFLMCKRGGGIAESYKIKLVVGGVGLWWAAA